MLILMIAGAGAAGSVSRYLVSRLMAQAVSSQWLPAGTLTVNVVGCFLIGMVAGIAAERGLFSPQGRTVMTAGFLGGFTTFSAFGLETFVLARQDQMAGAIGNVALHLALGVGAVWLGHVAGQRV